MNPLQLLTVAFVLCKIIGVAPIAGWSWWWVLSPMLIPLGFGLSCFALGGIITGIDEWVKQSNKKNNGVV